MRSPLHLKAAVALTMLAAALQSHLHEVQAQARSQRDRGDGPIPTVIILLATIAGAAMIAGTLAAVYGKYNGKIMGK
ncbi:hypothetical protein ACFY0Z_29380 [Streptomyces kronopolitis]|uniref:hypothetical protein n=1 Tax=Streptomyces kronopolitis TaxID=1612435 RepID=UPI00367A4FF3